MRCREVVNIKTQCMAPSPFRVPCPMFAHSLDDLISSFCLSIKFNVFIYIFFALARLSFRDCLFFRCCHSQTRKIFIAFALEMVLARIYLDLH